MLMIVTVWYSSSLFSGSRRIVSEDVVSLNSISKGDILTKKYNLTKKQTTANPNIN